MADCSICSSISPSITPTSHVMALNAWHMQDATLPAQPETSASNGSGEGSPRLRQLVANPLSQQERVSAEALAGQWKVLDLTAVPIEEKDVLTGEVKSNAVREEAFRERWCVCHQMIFMPTCMLRHLAGSAGVPFGSESSQPAALLSHTPTVQLLLSAGVVRKVNVFFSQQTEQTWDPPASTSLSEDGAAMWLPHRLMVELRMVPAVGENVHAWLVGGVRTCVKAGCGHASTRSVHASAWPAD